jgi:hypothetical protein
MGKCATHLNICKPYKVFQKPYRAAYTMHTLPGTPTTVNVSTGCSPVLTGVLRWVKCKYPQQTIRTPQG